MTGEPGRGDPGDIPAPEVAPPDDADSLTTKEIKRADRRKPPTPTEAHQAATALHREDLCRERDRALEIIKIQQSEMAALRGKLSRIEPRYEAIKQAKRGFDVNATMALAATGFGSLLVGIGGVAPFGWNVLLLTAGAVVNVYGISHQALNMLKAWPEDRDEVPDSVGQ